MIPDTLLNQIARGEGSSRQFKQNITNVDSLLRWAFANADGE